MKLKLEEHSLSDVIRELKKLQENGCKRLCIICNDKYTLKNGDPLIDGENVTGIGCDIVKLKNRHVACLNFYMSYERKAMKLNDIIFYLENLPIVQDLPIALDINGCTLEYDCKVLDDDDIWNVTVK